MPPSLIASVDHIQAVLPAGCHGFFGHDVLAGSGGLNNHLRVQTAGGADGYQVAIGFSQKFRKIFIGGHLVLVGVGGQYL